MQFAPYLEVSAHRSCNGEYAWRRPEALRAARALADAGYAILGGELWAVRGREVWGAIPQRSGPPTIYHWEAEPAPSEAWDSFVVRAHVEARAAINSLPGDDEVAIPADADICYNLTWISEQEYADLSSSHP